MSARDRKEAWRLALSAPARLRDEFAHALEPFAASVAFTEPDRQGLSLIEAIATAAPNRAMVEAALALVSASLGLPEPGVAIERLPAKDWLAQSKRAFAPFRVGRFFIHGSDFRDRVPAGCIGLGIDAGMAFGTGRHESTQGCLLALEWLAYRLPRRGRVRNALDLGCGCGILAVAAARLWPAKVLACDIDPEALPVARGTIARNGLGSRVQVCWSDGVERRVTKRRAPFDLIAANIIAPPLLAMARPLSRALAPGGRMVLSGLVADEARAVERRYRALGLRPVRRIGVGAWRTLILKRPCMRRASASRLVPRGSHA